MYKRFFLLLLTFTLTIMIAVSCSNSNGENGEQNNVKEPPQTENDENDNDVNNGNTEENDDGNLNEEDNNADTDTSNQDQGASADKELPDPIEINKKVQHPNGVLFILENITFKDDHILIDFFAQNGHGSKINLAKEGRSEQGDLGGITLQDDTGFNYLYLASKGSHRIDVFKDQKVTGTLSFMGRLNDEAQSLTLIFNPDESEDDRKTKIPKFVFEDIDINW